MTETFSRQPRLVVVPTGARSEADGAPPQEAIDRHPAGRAWRTTHTVASARHGVPADRLVAEIGRWQRDAADFADRHVGASTPAQLADGALALLRRGAELRSARSQVAGGLPLMAALGGLDAVLEWLRGVAVVVVERPMPVEVEELLGVAETEPRTLRLVEDPDRGRGR